MQAENTVMEIIQANNQYVRQNYIDECTQLRESLPVADPLPERSPAEQERMLTQRIQVSNEREVEQLNEEMPLTTDEANSSTQQMESNPTPKRKNNTLTQSDIEVIKFIYNIEQLSKEEKIVEVQKKIKISRAYLLMLFRKLKNKQSIDKSVVRRGRRVKYHANTP